MSSHVVVLDSTARRATIKTTPGKYLTDILQEACTKLGVDASQHGLKYKTKQLDLSLEFRLSGLIPGAKLELVQLSRSPSVVNVALQLPASEAHGVTNGRLMDKFPSTTSIWMILRKFEAGVAGSAPARNLTGRGVPITGESGSGRLFYETPVIQILNRELCNFTHLQKSLAQMGFNTGNVLLRLSFRRTDEPLEVAMVKIQAFFKMSDDDAAQATKEASAQKANETTQSSLMPPESTLDASPEVPIPPEPQEESSSTAPSGPPPDSAIEPLEGLSNAAPRPVTVFAPPSSNTPQSAQTAYNDNDYVPSVEHAQVHQRRLLQASKPTRLPTDAEIAALAAAEEERRLSVKEVEVKVRFPDQSQVVAKFGQQDTGKALHDFVRSCLAAPYANERFTLIKFSGNTPTSSGTTKVHKTTSTGTPKAEIPDSDRSYLIKHHGMTGRVLVNFSWSENASASVRQGRPTALLKPELRTQAQEFKVKPPPDVMDMSEDSPSVKLGESSRSNGEKRKGGALPKWLKLPGKK